MERGNDRQITVAVTVKTSMAENGVQVTENEFPPQGERLRHRGRSLRRCFSVLTGANWGNVY